MRRTAAALIGAMLVAEAPAAAVPIGFLVAEAGTSFHGDSYVLPLDDPAAIAHARELIEQGLAA